MYVYLNNFHSKHLRSCRLPTFLQTWSDSKTFINMYICTYVSMYVENYHVDNYFSKITMYYFILLFTVCTIILLLVLIKNVCFIVNSLDAEDGEPNKVISPGPILASVSSSTVFFHQGKSRRSRCSRFVSHYCYLWWLSIASNSVIPRSPLARPFDSLQQICGGRILVRPFHRMYD